MGIMNSIVSTAAALYDSYAEEGSFASEMGEREIQNKDRLGQRMEWFGEVKKTCAGKVERNAIAQANNNHLKYVVSA